MSNSFESIFVNAEQIDVQNAILLSIANKMGAYTEPQTWAEFQANVRAGSIGMYISPGDQLVADSSLQLTVTCDGDGVVSATVDPATFFAEAGSEKTDYVFVYETNVWKYNGVIVTLAEYGISITSGTAADGDVITVHKEATQVDFDVQGVDEDEPADSTRSHVVSIQAHEILNRIVFDPAQYLFAVTEASLQDLGISGSSLPAGTYNVTLSHGAFNGGTSEDGTFQFTTTASVPIGGGIRHSYIGTVQDDPADYNKTNVVAGTFTTYGADTLTVIESNLATVEGSDGTSLGTTTAYDPAYLDGDFINFTQRQRYGSNRWGTSYIRQYLNSDADPFVWTPKTIWSRNATSEETVGFLNVFDPAFTAVIGRVRKRYALSAADGGGYEDLVDYVTLDTLLDVGEGQNSGISEGPVNERGTVTRTTAYTLWQGADDSARVKYVSGTATVWWLASSGVQTAHTDMYVSTTGGVGDTGASDSFGIAPTLYII